MTGFDVLTNSHGILIEVCTHVSGFNCGFDCTYRYEFSGNGILSVTLEAVPFGVPMDLPRFGLDIILPETMEKHCWYGRGPFENYVDRCAAAPLGRYESTVTEQYVPHIIPQACGNKTGVRWATFSDDQGHGLQIKSSSHFECSALHYTAEDLSSARHCWELQPRPEIYCTLDWMQRGVGEGGCGVDTLDQYRLRRLPQSIHFIFSPL